MASFGAEMADATVIERKSLFPDGIIDQITTALVMIDSDSFITAINMAAETLLEVSAARVVGEHLATVINADDEWGSTLSQAAMGGYPIVKRGLGMSLRSGAEHVIDLAVTPLAQDDKDLLLLEMTMVDRLQRISEGESLWQSQLTLRAVVRGLAHEVKNPLGGIRGAAQLLSRELPDPALGEYTDVIIEEVDRLRGLVDQMLGPKEQLELEKLNIHEVIERVRQLLQVEAGTGLTLVRDYDPSLPEFPADRAQLTQALLNIARNAWQACGSEGEIILRTRAQRQYTIGGTRRRLVCAVEIIDNGPGIPEEFLPQLFIPMVTTRAEGTGLGLSISQVIANRHGGLIQCQSEPGNTCFTLLLPMES